MQLSPGPSWAIVLAGGDGRRLVTLTRALYGCDLPKQFADLDGRGTLLQQTMSRVGRLIPPERTLVVVGARWAGVARRQIEAFPGATVLPQPRNLDTGPGILLALAIVRRIEPMARVGVFPSDHFIPDEEPFVAAASAALRQCNRASDRVVLLGIDPDGPETAYGWIVPGTPIPGELHLRGVQEFIEKPAADVARRLHHAGALWNTLVIVGRVDRLWEMAREGLPAHIRAFEVWSSGPGQYPFRVELGPLYARLVPASFSRSVLEIAGGLAVIPVRASGWSDWGEPERVLLGLMKTTGLGGLRARLRSGPESQVIRETIVRLQEAAPRERAGTCALSS